ncbi:MAG: hypothetical protein IPH09_14850 [bacterium]|nr:hypothetical protein [bacterium]MBK7702552.1 hypothetical protein [bacterium]MBK9303952.1 hypothetical protein [bacterium]
MAAILQKWTRVLDRPIRNGVRLGIALLVLPLAASFLFPLWTIRMEAPQYPQGLSMDIYAYRLSGGHDGRDIAEINNLNHYIGMMKIERSSIPELGWIPFAFGFLALLALRAAALGTLRDLVDLCVLLAYVTVFFFGRFILMLYNFGHRLAPEAAIKVEPFMPVVIGTKQIANFTTHSLPNFGTLFLVVFAAGVALATARNIGLEWKRTDA